MSTAAFGFVTASVIADGSTGHQSNVVIGNRPTVPKRVVTGNKNVQKILGDLEKIKRAAKSKKLTKLQNGVLLLLIN